jgi:hypothetical protein
LPTFERRSIARSFGFSLAKRGLKMRLGIRGNAGRTLKIPFQAVKAQAQKADMASVLSANRCVPFEG